MCARVRSLGLVVALCACHAGATTTTTTTRPDSVPSQPASRHLGGDTRFAELVGRARSLEAAGDAETSARCVLGRDGGDLTLAASVTPAIRPLPDASDGLAERAMQSTTVTVLSRWGRTGEGPLALATITPCPPLAPRALVLVITPRGIYLRTTSGELPARARGTWALGTVREGLSSLDVAQGDTVIVTADASMAVSTVAEVLEAISPLRVYAVLAVALPQGTPIPSEPALPPPSTTCESLPGLDANAPLGEARAGDVRRGAATLSDFALACARTTSSLAVARGGRVDLLLRIGPDGRGGAAGGRADAIGDEAFRTCLLGAARRLAFAPPQPAGYVDVAAPVRLRADTSDALAPTCTP